MSKSALASAASVLRSLDRNSSNNTWNDLRLESNWRRFQLFWLEMSMKLSLQGFLRPIINLAKWQSPFRERLHQFVHCPLFLQFFAPVLSRWLIPGKRHFYSSLLLLLSVIVLTIALNVFCQCFQYLWCFWTFVWYRSTILRRSTTLFENGSDAQCCIQAG